MKPKSIFIRLPLLLTGLFLMFNLSCGKDDDKDSRDGKFYKTVKIGKQVWMAENLAYAPSSGNYWAYDNNNENVETYGYLYDWHTALIVCPTGWHLPGDAEWIKLEMALGMSQSDADDTYFRGTNEGSKLAGNAGLWADGSLVNHGDFGKTGFTALPGGYLHYVGEFGAVGENGMWWSATQLTTDNAFYRLISYSDSSIYSSDGNKKLGKSVRCVRD